MHPGYTTITPAVVHRLASAALESTLGLKPYKASVSVRQLLDLVLLIAAGTCTLFAVARRHFSFSHQTARQALEHNLPTPENLTAHLVDALFAVATFGRRDRRRRWTVAIDTHDVPYYGSRFTVGIIGGQKKQGTKYFFRYATAILTHRRRRYTVGFLAVTKGIKPHQVVKTLLDQITSHGLTVGGVVLDSGFDSGETILLLQDRKVSYTVPLRRKGNKSNRRNDYFTKPSGTLGTVAWVTEESRRAVSTRVLVWRRKGQPDTKVYAFAGWGDARAVSEAKRAYLARRRYRDRFGIETSYRQKNQGRGWTTSRSVTYRLLLEGVALVLRQVWVCLTQQIAKARGLSPSAWVEALPLVELVEWLADHLRDLYPHQRRIDLTPPILTDTATP